MAPPLGLPSGPFEDLVELKRTTQEPCGRQAASSGHGSLRVAFRWFALTLRVQTPPKKVFWGCFGGLNPFSGGTWTLRVMLHVFLLKVCVFVRFVGVGSLGLLRLVFRRLPEGRLVFVGCFVSHGTVGGMN